MKYKTWIEQETITYNDLSTKIVYKAYVARAEWWYRILFNRWVREVTVEWKEYGSIYILVYKGYGEAFNTVEEAEKAIDWFLDVKKKEWERQKKSIITRKIKYP